MYVACRLVVMAALASSLAGCVFGGGPLVGYGQHGWFAGAEAGGGAGLQGTVGYQTRRHLLYVRADVADEAAASLTSQTPFGFRIGGGVGIDVADPASGEHGVFVGGPNVGTVLDPPGVSSTWHSLGLVEVQLRYATEWQVALAARIEYGQVWHSLFFD